MERIPIFILVDAVGSNPAIAVPKRVGRRTNCALCGASSRRVRLHSSATGPGSRARPDVT